MTSIAIISAGTEATSQSNALAGCFEDQLRRSELPVQPDVIRLRPLAPSILLASLTGEREAELAEALRFIRQATALILITPLHNGSYSGLFKMFVDLIEPDTLRSKPVLLAGSAGSTRATLALDGPVRSLFGTLRALVAPTVVMATPGEWVSAGIPGPELDGRIARATKELLALAGCGTP